MIQTLNRILIGFAFLLLAYLFIVYVAYAVNLIQFPFDYDQGEGFELVDVMMFSQFKFPYADIESYPFYGSIYPPLYHVILVPLAWIFGAEYWYGRLFSFITTLITAMLIGYAVYKETIRRTPDANHFITRWVAVLAGLVFLASNIVYHIGPLFRQHISMVMFETAAVVVLAHVNEIQHTRRRRYVLFVGFALLIAAGYTKQLAAFTAIAVLIFLFIRNPRRALTWGAGFTLVGMGIFAALTILTNGHWWTQTIVANVKDFDLNQAEGLFRLFIRTHLWLVIPALLMIVYEVYLDRISIYAIWFVVTLGLSAYSAGTWGAGDSYYATAVAAMAILSGIFAARTLTNGWGLPRFTRILSTLGLIVIPLLYIEYAVGVFHTPTTEFFFRQVTDALNIEDNTGYNYYDPDGYITLAYAQIGHFTTDADIQNGNRIVDHIAAIPPDVPVLSEEAAFSFATDREVITNPVVLYILDQVGAYDSSELVAMIEAQDFGLIVLRAQFFPPAVNRAITIYYEETERIPMNGFDYIILYPRDEPLIE
ncbi:MAG: hypothetical protein D6711_06735 [Chloroflexi bacterium]|nr:MAG: hypothetical protein D6711_06735 [Chloroflexota bacterium]